MNDCKRREIFSSLENSADTGDSCQIWCDTGIKYDRDITSIQVTSVLIILKSEKKMGI